MRGPVSGAEVEYGAANSRLRVCMSVIVLSAHPLFDQLMVGEEFNSLWSR